MLRNLLVGAAEDRKDIKIAPAAPNRAAVAETLRAGPADVVILRLEDSELPAVCDKLLAEFPEATLVGLARDGCRTSLYLDDIGQEELFDVLSAARRASAKRGES